MSLPSHSSHLSSKEKELADLLGIQTCFWSNFGHLEEASSEVFHAVVKELLREEEQGLEIDVLLGRLKKEREARLLPEYVCEAPGATWELPEVYQARWKSLPTEVALKNEKGDEEVLSFEGGKFQLPERLEFGPYTLKVGEVKSFLLCAPKKSRPLPEEKSWGYFAPLYALRSENSWGAGDYSDLKNFSVMAADQGARTVATLPLLPNFLSEWKDDPSPYSPASRVFWSEFYVDPTQSPEWAEVPEAQKLYQESKALIEELNESEHVQYRKIFELKMQVLSLLAEYYFEEGDPSRLRNLVQEKHDVVQYARFRAYADHFQKPWTMWSEELKQGDLPPLPECKKLEQAYLYGQLLANEQISECARSSAEKGLSFYLDLPVGVHSDGFDVYRNPHLYCTRLSAGAPPDPFFSAGQDWGFPPFNPREIVGDQVKHFREVLRHHLSHASLLRVDHVMGLHRIFVIPRGYTAREGLYITFPKELLYGALLIEAERAHATVVGENLGTVPPEVNEKMAEHGLAELYVWQYMAHPEKGDLVGSVKEQSVASLNTHDMPFFLAYWRGQDLQERLEMGLLDEAGMAEEEKTRRIFREKWTQLLLKQGYLEEASTADLLDKGLESLVFEATMKWLFASGASISLLTLEDIWGETRAQNVPGTYKEKPNWLRKTRLSLEEIESSKELGALVERLVPFRR